MSNLIVLAACLVAGVLLRARGHVRADAHLGLNGYLLHVALPAATLRGLHGFRFEPQHLLPVLMPWALFALGAGVFHAAGRAWKLPAASVGALTLVGGLGNTSFVGLPMIEALQGRDGLALGLVISQLGTYLALATVGIGAASLYADSGPVDVAEMARRVLRFPPFLALLAALLLSPFPFPPALDQALASVGDTLAPVALCSVGMQLRLDAWREHRRPLCLGLGFKLIASPALVVAGLWATGARGDMVTHVSVIAAAMPPMIGAAALATQMRLAPGLVAMMVGLGIPLGLCTAPAWFWLSGRLSG